MSNTYAPNLEILEDRYLLTRLPIPTITWDYSHDNSGFFNQSQSPRKVVLEEAGLDITSRLIGHTDKINVTVEAKPYGGLILAEGSGNGISFNSDLNWSTSDKFHAPAPDQYDLLSVTEHELGHVLGIGTSSQWFNQVRDGHFTGPNTVATYGIAPGLNQDNAHWATDVIFNGQRPCMTPYTGPGLRHLFTQLDFAALHDIGW